VEYSTVPLTVQIVGTHKPLPPLPPLPLLTKEGINNDQGI